MLCNLMRIQVVMNDCNSVDGSGGWISSKINQRLDSLNREHYCRDDKEGAKSSEATSGVSPLSSSINMRFDAICLNNF